MSDITVDPRDAFEKVFPPPKHVIRCGKGYACTEYNAWDAQGFIKKWEGRNACRAAMLQGAEPVGQNDELPLDYLQGHKDGLEWAARLAEANHPQTGDWLYDDPLELAKAIRKGLDMPEADGNSPAIPDSYDIESFGIFRASEGSSGFIVEIDQFRFGTEKCPRIGKTHMVPKFALQAIINALQQHCDSMEEVPLLAEEVNWEAK